MNAGRVQRRCILTALALMLTAVWAWPVFGVDREALTVAEVLRIGLFTHPGMEQAALLEEAGLARAQQARAHTVLSIRSGVEGTRVYGEDEQFPGPPPGYAEAEIDAITERIDFQWPIPFMPGVKAQRGLAAAMERSAALDARAVREGVVLQLLQAAAELIQADAAVEKAEARLKLAEERYREAQARRSAGRAAEHEALAAEAERQGALAELRREEGRRRRAAMALNRALGRPLDMPVEVAPDLPATRRTAGETAQTAPPIDVEQAGLGLLQAREMRRLAWVEQLPTLQVFGERYEDEVTLNAAFDLRGMLLGGVSRQRSWTDLTVPGPDLNGAGPPPPRDWMIGLRLEWPLLDGGARRAKLREAERSERLAELQLKEAERQAEMAQAQAEAELDSALEALSAARRGEEAAAAALAAVEAMAEAGAATQAQVLEAAWRYAEARHGRLAAETGALLLEADLARINGQMEAWLRANWGLELSR